MKFLIYMLIQLWNLVMLHFLEHISYEDMHSNTRFSFEIALDFTAPIESAIKPF